MAKSRSRKSRGGKIHRVPIPYVEFFEVGGTKPLERVDPTPIYKSEAVPACDGDGEWINPCRPLSTSCSRARWRQGGGSIGGVTSTRRRMAIVAEADRELWKAYVAEADREGAWTSVMRKLSEICPYLCIDMEMMNCLS